jgi:multimeric flavodoxin WrbA
MMKEIKIVAVISSAHNNGNGAQLAREVLKGAQKQGAATEEIFLQKENIHFCTGCLKCISSGLCPISDDFEKIRNTLYNADGIILCSPTFSGTINAAMKNLFDRLGMYERCTSMLSDKYVIGLSTASKGSAAKKTANELAASVSNSTFKRSMISGVMGVSIVPNGVSENSDCLNDAFKLGEKLTLDIKNKKKYSCQNILGRVVMHNFVQPVMRKYIINNKETATKAAYDNLCQRGLL